jgi:hypothetical protein
MLRSAHGAEAATMNWKQPSALAVKAGHSGYPKISGRVIRVVRNSGIENCYPIFALKKHYPKFRVPDNSGSGFTRYTRNWQNQPFWKNSSTILK